MKKLFFNDFITELLPYLDIKNGYNFLLAVNNEKYIDQINKMKEILDEYDKFENKAYSKEILEDIGSSSHIVVNPSEIFLEILRKNNYKPNFQQIEEEFERNSNFKMSDNEGAYPEYHSTYKKFIYAGYSPTTSEEECEEEDIKETCIDPGVIVVKSKPEKNIHRPYVLVGIYEKNCNQGPYFGLGWATQEASDNGCNEFQDYFPFLSNYDDHIGINCNLDSPFYGKLGYLFAAEEATYAEDLDISLSELLNLKNKKEFIELVESRLDFKYEENGNEFYAKQNFSHFMIDFLFQYC